MAIPSWLHLSQVSGSGDTIITITADTWDGLVERTASLVVSGNTKSVTVPVLQHFYDPAVDYFTFDIVDGGTIFWTASGNYGRTIQYRINGGEWTSIKASSSASINVSAGDSIEFKGNNSTYHPDGHIGGHFRTSGATFTAKGNIMSLVYGDNYEGKTVLSEDETFSNLFLACHGLLSAEKLVLPATILSEYCYAHMFDYCDNMTVAPVLPATTLQAHCYDHMFTECYALTKITCLATNISAVDCTYEWVEDVGSSGTFVKNPEMTSWETNPSGIPPGWTVVDYNP